MITLVRSDMTQKLKPAILTACFCMKVIPDTPYMPELPEVETTRQGIKPYVEGQTIQKVIIRDYRLRWPVPENLSERLEGKSVKAIHRRAKYLSLDVGDGFLIIHLGMSGSLRIPSAAGICQKTLTMLI